MTKESRWLALFVVLAAAALQAFLAATEAPNPARAPQTVMVPAGTVLNVRLSEGVDVDSTETGATFNGRLDDPIMIEACDDPPWRGGRDPSRQRQAVRDLEGQRPDRPEAELDLVR